MSTNARAPVDNRGRAPVIRAINHQKTSVNLLRIIPAWIVSIVAHGFILALFMGFSFWMNRTYGQAPPPNDASQQETAEVEDPGDKADLTNPDIGIDPTQPLAYNVDRIEDVSVPGPVDVSQAIGVPGAPADAPMQNVPAPPGFGEQGLGQSSIMSDTGKAALGSAINGSGGLTGLVPGGFGGRSGATRVKMAFQGGGNAKSEAAVAAGLLFLARHQAPDGHWSLDQFQLNCHDYDKGGVNATRFNSNATGQGTKNDTAGTAFGLLPFLGAGETHKPPSQGDERKIHYQKVVEAGLHWLIAHQGRDGDLGGGMYSHGLATIALCEAYGLTSDPTLKGPAQKAVDFIVKAQDPNGGGWRYTPRSGGDTSVVGWQVMALKSAQMSGLSVPGSTLKGAEKWLDSCATSDKGGYGYTGPQETPTMTAVGLLCRQYLGWSPKNPGLLAGIPRLKQVMPRSTNSIYYYYYATQVMHHMGGDDWEAWNPAMRDWLIETQDQGNDAKRPYQKGSWDPKSDIHGAVGGRMMTTSLSLLCLEVYYRHLPLYKRDLGGLKEMTDKE